MERGIGGGRTHSHGALLSTLRGYSWTSPPTTLAHVIYKTNELPRPILVMSTQACYNCSKRPNHSGHGHRGRTQPLVNIDGGTRKLCLHQQPRLPSPRYMTGAAVTKYDVVLLSGIGTCLNTKTLSLPPFASAHRAPFACAWGMVAHSFLASCCVHQQVRVAPPKPRSASL